MEMIKAMVRAAMAKAAIVRAAIVREAMERAAMERAVSVTMINRKRNLHRKVLVIALVCLIMLVFWERR